MKKILTIGALMLGTFGFLNAQEIEISESNVDLGTIKYGGKAVTTVLIKNTGDKDLVISKVEASCGCTVPKWPTAPIKPGDSAEMTVEYTTTKKAGPFNKTATIVSNAITEGRKIFRIKGVVEANPNAPKSNASSAKQ